MNPQPQNKKNLVLLCDSYPLSAGEFFIDDEMRVVAASFKKVYVLIKEQDFVRPLAEQKDLNRYIPQNLEVITYDDKISRLDKIKAIPYIFSFIFISELFRAVFKFK